MERSDVVLQRTPRGRVRSLLRPPARLLGEQELLDDAGVLHASNVAGPGEPPQGDGVGDGGEASLEQRVGVRKTVAAQRVCRISGRLSRWWKTPACALVP